MSVSIRTFGFFVSIKTIFIDLKINLIKNSFAFPIRIMENEFYITQ